MGGRRVVCRRRWAATCGGLVPFLAGVTDCALKRDASMDQYADGHQAIRDYPETIAEDNGKFTLHCSIKYLEHRKRGIDSPRYQRLPAGMLRMGSEYLDDLRDCGDGAYETNQHYELVESRSPAPIHLTPPVQVWSRSPMTQPPSLSAPWARGTLSVTAPNVPMRPRSRWPCRCPSPADNPLPCS